MSKAVVQLVDIETHVKSVIIFAVKARNAPAASLKAIKSKLAKEELKLATLKKQDKVCTVCAETKSKEHFTKAADQLDGYNPMCKQCKNTRAKNNRLSDIESKRARDRAYGAAHKKEKARSDKIYRDANIGKLRIVSTNYYHANKEDIATKNKVKRLNRNPEEILIDQKRSRETYQNRSEASKLAKYNYGKTYYKSPNGKITGVRNAAKRRANKISTEDGSVTSQALEELKDKQNYCCYYCAEPLDFLGKRSVHLDHYMPLSKGGSHSITNVVWSCPTCNLKKGSTVPIKEINFLKERTIE